MAREPTDIEQAPARHVCGLCRRFVLSISGLFDAAAPSPWHMKPLSRCIFITQVMLLDRKGYVI